MIVVKKVILLWLFLASLISATACANSSEEGMTTADFRGLVSSLPEFSGKIVGIQIFRDSNTHTNSVAFLTATSSSNWQISIFSNGGSNKYVLEWESERLDDGFTVSSPYALKVTHVDDEEAIEFSGCAPHVCPDVFSVLLYIPSKKAAFIANYIQGAVTYSKNLSDASNASYKSVLDSLVRKHKDRN